MRQEKSLKPQVKSLKSNEIVGYIEQATGLPEEAIRRILLLIDFATYTQDGKRTKFAKDNGIYTYTDFLKWIQQHIRDFEDKDFVSAVSVKYNSLVKSLYSRVGSWIYKTYIVKSPDFQDLDDKQKVITANFFGVSFINRTYGQLLQMVNDNPDTILVIFKTLDKSRTELRKLIGTENYQKSKEDEE
jgi:hypothetical protein